MSHPTVTRRTFCQAGVFSLTPLAIASLLRQERTSAEPVKPNLTNVEYTLDARKPPREPQATAMISLFMQGG
ncbi:MAG: hypothetical protein KDA84_03020, partial [Planctomycetaceae bacterium]|nr:hypothetical protein [Planctomycetaceae bacterium]